MTFTPNSPQNHKTKRCPESKKNPVTVGLDSDKELIKPTNYQLTVSEVQTISYVPNLLNKRDKKRTAAAVDKWMEIVGFDEEIKSRYPAELSGGQQQRVGIARALAASPEILLMDEPFGAVDEITRKQLQKELKEIYQKSGITVLFVTHDIDEALLLGTKVLVMNAGKIEQFASPEQLLQNPATEFARNLVGK